LEKCDAETKPQASPTVLADPLSGLRFDFSIAEGFDATQPPESAPWQMRITPASGNPSLGNWVCPPPQPSLPDYSGYSAVHIDPRTGEDRTVTFEFAESGGTLLTANLALASSERRVSLGPLNVIDHHNGRCSLSITRNAGLQRRLCTRHPS